MPIRSSGRGRGIFAYVPHALIGVVSIELETPHCLWLRVKGGACDGVDLFVGIVYLPPAHGAAANHRAANAMPFKPCAMTSSPFSGTAA